MFRASRYRLSPNKTQEQQFQRLCGASPGLISAGDSRG